jgi:hypothetical protein
LVDKDTAGHVIAECTERFLLTMQNLTELSLIQSGIKECVRIQGIFVSTIFSPIDKFFKTLTNHKRDNVRIIFEENYYDVCITTDKEVLTEILFHFITTSMSSFHNTCIYIGYLLDEKSENIIFYVSNSDHLFIDRSQFRWEDDTESESKKSMYTDGLGVALILIREYGFLINAEIKVSYDNYVNTFYCRIPLTDKNFKLC